VTSQPYAIVTNPNRPTVDASTLGLSSAKQVEQPDELHRHCGQFAGQLPAYPCEQRDGEHLLRFLPDRHGRDGQQLHLHHWLGQPVHQRLPIHLPHLGMGHLQPQHRRHVLLGRGVRLWQLRQPVFCTQVNQTKKPSVTNWPPGAGLGMVFTETDTTYNCGAQTNYGSSASKTYCINHTTLCFEPPPQDLAPVCRARPMSGRSRSIRAQASTMPTVRPS
jgi:conjugal transfer mating pair stabilization protein TraN